MVCIYDEEDYEKSIVELFQNLGYSYYCGLDIGRDYKNHLFKLDLDNLYGINNSLNGMLLIKLLKLLGILVLVLLRIKTMDLWIIFKMELMLIIVMMVNRNLLMLS